MCAPMRIHGAARLVGRQIVIRNLVSPGAVVRHIKVRTKVLGTILVLDFGGNIVQGTLDVAFDSTIVAGLGCMGYVILVQALTLVPDAALGGGLLALGFGGALVDKVKVRVHGAGLVHDRTANWRDIL